jgi:hypothetical protein
MNTNRVASVLSYLRALSDPSTDGHLSDEMIVRSVNNELSAEEAKVADLHLVDCLPCSDRRAALQEELAYLDSPEAKKRLAQIERSIRLRFVTERFASALGQLSSRLSDGFQRLLPPSRDAVVCAPALDCQKWEIENGLLEGAIYRDESSGKLTITVSSREVDELREAHVVLRNGPWNRTKPFVLLRAQEILLAVFEVSAEESALFNEAFSISLTIGESQEVLLT